MNGSFDPGDFRLAPEPMAPLPEIDRREITGVFLRIGLVLSLMMLLHIGLSLVLSVLLRTFFPAFAARPEAVWVADSIPFDLLVLPLCIFLLSLLPQRVPAKQSLGKGGYFAALAVSCTLLVAGSMIGTTVSSVIESLTHTPPSSASDYLGQGNFFIALLCVGILAPVMEELFFRRALMNALGRFGEGPAILVSALVFGLGHGNFTQFFFAFGLGLAFGYIYAKSGRVWLTILPHAVINSVSTVLSFFVLPRMEPIYDWLENLENLPDPEMMLSEISQIIWPVLGLLAYEGILYGGALVGLILFCVYFRRIRLERAEYVILPPEGYGTFAHPLSGGDLVGPAFRNVGTWLFLIVCAGYFVLSILPA
ncbi:MAG: CPBP family intramembrane metalloprotease [Eubacteriales bacterium]|nr:CPBP family intramembrane metalloprotease [Eubacteriales bacterium]